MKINFSFILFFVFLFCSSQEIADKEKFKKCRKEFSKKICLSDEDKDSVLFYLDECPKVFGVAENNGCPWKDTDNDGIVDKDDVCVDVVGPSENKGCPWPDTDGDGVLDKDDRCSTVAGQKESEGCDCLKKYNEEKANYEKSLKELETSDFNKLFDIIFLDQDFKLLYSKKVIFLVDVLGNGGPECGNDPYYNCKHFEKNIQQEIFKKEWNQENFLKFKRKLGNRTIIPVASFSISGDLFFGEQNDDLNYFNINRIKSKYEGIYITNNNQTKFYYSSYVKPKSKLTLKKEDNGKLNIDYIKFALAITPNNYDNLLNSYIIQLQFFDDKSNYKTTTPKIYQFKNGNWYFIKDYN